MVASHKEMETKETNNHKEISNKTSGCDERPIVEKEVDICRIREHFMKQELLRKLENKDIADVAKLRLISKEMHNFHVMLDNKVFQTEANDITRGILSRSYFHWEEEKLDENWE